MTPDQPGFIVEALEVKDLELAGIKVFLAKPKRDIRGTVLPTYNKLFFAQIGLDFDVIHENRCVSPKAGTIRGFHYQLPPYGQPKLVQVTRGRILDAVVDLRRSSATFGRHLKVELYPSSWSQVFIPVGFAHCYCTLEDHTEVIFKLGSPYAPDFAAGLAWNDPDLKIDWPVDEHHAIVLERDLKRPRFRDLTEFFS
jgi:dTDP-4-dehydrorhamnose 3,5-epimerase